MDAHEWLKQFPKHADVIAAEADETRDLSFDDCYYQLMQLLAVGDTLSTPASAAADRQFRDREKAKWWRAHREAFERHGH